MKFKTLEMLKLNNNELMCRMIKIIIKEVICFDSFFDVNRWYMLQRTWINEFVEMLNQICQFIGDGDVMKTIN